MLVVLSPAKSLDYETPWSVSTTTQPQFMKQAAQLVDILRMKGTAELSELMSISESLAALNARRYAQWSPTLTYANARPALLAFNGDVYDGFDAKTLNEKGIEFAQKYVRILSGLYGILRPLDLMQPYRLEMGTKLPNPVGQNLYVYWQDKLATALNTELDAGASVLVNLASDEYFKSIDLKTLNARVVKPVFRDYKNSQYKVISFFSKKARGFMARYIVDHQVTEVEQLKKFNVAGYFFVAGQSTDNTWVFHRKEAKF